MASTETAPKPDIASFTEIPEIKEVPGKDGYPERVWMVDGKEVTFSLRPFDVDLDLGIDERPVYWCPKGIGKMHMWWRSQTLNRHGIQPIIQREFWHDGVYRPRNPWEEHMTRAWLRRRNWNPDHLKGFVHPENVPGEPPHYWRCTECTWRAGTIQAITMHHATLQHKGLASE